MMSNYKIIDKNGTVHSGDEEDMRIAFAAMTNNTDFFESKLDFKEAKSKYDCEWSGDLELVLVLAVVR